MTDDKPRFTCRACLEVFEHLQDRADHDCPAQTGSPEDELDHQVEAASIPSLATLFKRGKERGLIKPGKEYGEAV